MAVPKNKRKRKRTPLQQAAFDKMIAAKNAKGKNASPTKTKNAAPLAHTAQQMISSNIADKQYAPGSQFLYQFRN